MRRLIAALVLLLPPLALMLFGWQLTADRDAVLQMQLRQLVDGRLAALDSDMNRWLMQQLTGLAPLPNVSSGQVDEPGVDGIKRSASLVRQVHVLSRSGNWRYPPQGQLVGLKPETVFAALADESNAQRPPPWYGKGSFSRQASPEAEIAAGVSADAGEVGRKGWLVRYQQQQLQLLRWLDAPNGDVWLFEISYPGLLAGLIGWLPDTNPENSGQANERYRLADGSGRVLYEWGRFEVSEQQPPTAQFTLTKPLSGWHIDYFSKATAANTLFEQLRWLLIAGAVALLTLMLGLWLWRKQQAELRLAEQRVSFVNQVSHELKTPLTNIRMYAELLQQKVADQPAAARQLGVVVSESQRLSRLINNVLSFGRGQRQQLQLQRRRGAIDDVVDEVLANWAIALVDAGIVVRFDAGASDEVLLDADALEQILNNLISNAEKYAAAGGKLTIRSSVNGGVARLLICDAGPGVPLSERSRVFESFYRRSDKTTEGVSGTGIGLGLARELARLHSGELKIIDSDACGQPQGCCFELTLEVN